MSKVKERYGYQIVTSWLPFAAILLLVYDRQINFKKKKPNEGDK